MMLCLVSSVSESLCTLAYTRHVHMVLHYLFCRVVRRLHASIAGLQLLTALNKRSLSDALASWAAPLNTRRQQVDLLLCHRVGMFQFLQMTTMG